MHVLVTADTISGTWAYVRELVTGLVTRGVRVTLVSFGEIPWSEQTAWMDSLYGLDYRPTAFRLEWMQEAQEDLPVSSAFLVDLIRDVCPDVVHLNQFCYGNLPVDVPKIVMAHGDVITWGEAVEGYRPRLSPWLRWYRDTVMRGISGADALIAPSAWMLAEIRRWYGRGQNEEVIYPGRNPIFFNPYISKEDSVLAIGRLIDAGKQVTLLTQCVHPLPVCIVGADQTVPASQVSIRADVKVATDESNLVIRGAQTEAQLRALYSRSSIYAATARYEPLGMNQLGAAFSRCAIVANDTPAFREIWGDAALYFRTNDARSLAECIRELSQDREMCRAYANLAYGRARERFSAKQMIDEHLELYRSLNSARVEAA
ncbi:MAG TPA: glycosyltransferase family 4 protein [Candidatus Sulfotelmatobacter sp.]|nr:glycosyltransferase family 4 protein [Candidatus Sulfotelmatobacter sp.]